MVRRDFDPSVTTVVLSSTSLSFFRFKTFPFNLSIFNPKASIFLWSLSCSFSTTFSFFLSSFVWLVKVPMYEVSISIRILFSGLIVGASTGIISWCIPEANYKLFYNLFLDCDLSFLFQCAVWIHCGWYNLEVREIHSLCQSHIFDIKQFSKEIFEILSSSTDCIFPTFFKWDNLIDKDSQKLLACYP